MCMYVYVCEGKREGEIEIEMEIEIERERDGVCVGVCGCVCGCVGGVWAIASWKLTPLNPNTRIRLSSLARDRN